MILLVAVVIGLFAAWLRALIFNRRLSLPDLHAVWLPPVAFAPQWVVFYSPRRYIPIQWEIVERMAGSALIVSQALLLVFGLLNRKHAGFKMLNTGLFLNLLVISANGGLMPISPETVKKLVDRELDTPSIGKRFGSTKDRLLYESETRFAWLADRFLLPKWIPYRVAFSLGDVFIAAGAFWFLWAAHRSQNQSNREIKDHVY